MCCCRHSLHLGGVEDGPFLAGGGGGGGAAALGEVRGGGRRTAGGQTLHATRAIQNQGPRGFLSVCNNNNKARHVMLPPK